MCNPSQKDIISKLVNKIAHECLVYSVNQERIIKIAKELTAFYFKYDPYHKIKPNGEGWIKTDRGWLQVDWTKITIYLYKNVRNSTIKDLNYLTGYFGLPKDIAVALLGEYDRRKLGDTVSMGDTRVRAIHELIEEFENKESVCV